MARGSNNIHNMQAHVGGVTEILRTHCFSYCCFDLYVLSGFFFFLLCFSSLSFYNEQFVKKKKKKGANKQLAKGKTFHIAITGQVALPPGPVSSICFLDATI